jgi:hypothetical protein
MLGNYFCKQVASMKQSLSLIWRARLIPMMNVSTSLLAYC